MAIQLDHFIVPTRDQAAAARLLAELLDVPWSETALGPFSPVFITLDWPKFAQATDYQYFRDNIKKGFQNGSGGYIREVVSAAYVETTGRTQLFGGTLRYNAGVRYAETKQTIGALSVGADPRNAALQNGGLYDNIGVWAYESVKYGNALPSGTLAYNITPKLILRASGSKSMTRASPADLRQTQLTLGDQGARQGSVTNPKLKPFEAENLDVGLEYYMTRESYVSASGFAKDIISRPGQRITTYSLAQLDQMFGTIGLTDAQQQSHLHAAPAPSPKDLIHTAIWDETPEADNAFATRSARLRGYDVYGEMVGRARWIDMLWLLLRSEL
eukprot:gene39903-49319_t